MKKTVITAAFLFTIGCTAALAAHTPTDSTSNSRNILSTQLPATLRKDLKKEYKDYWISELYEQGSNNHFVYHITLENADQVVKLDATNSKSWTVDSTVLKSI